MRLTKTLTAVTAAVALTALAGCGDDSGPLAALGLPKADNMAAIEKLINAHTTCRELESGEQHLDEDLAKKVKDKAFAIKESATCKDEHGKKIYLLLLSDMKKFQEANKKALEADPDADTSYLIGQNFVAIGTADATNHQLKSAGLSMMSCEPDRKAQIPSGYKTSEPLVKGCFVTDYFPS